LQKAGSYAIMNVPAILFILIGIAVIFFGGEVYWKTMKIP